MPCGMACKRARLVSLSAISNVKLDQSFSFTSQDQFLVAGWVVSLWILQGCLGGRSLPTERTFLEKRLGSAIHSPQTKLCTGARFLSHPGILSDHISLIFPRKTEVSAEAPNKMH